MKFGVFAEKADWDSWDSIHLWVQVTNVGGTHITIAVPENVDRTGPDLALGARWQLKTSEGDQIPYSDSYLRRLDLRRVAGVTDYPAQTGLPVTLTPSQNLVFRLGWPVSMWDRPPDGSYLMEVAVHSELFEGSGGWALEAARAAERWQGQVDCGYLSVHIEAGDISLAAHETQ